mmetsp:Transcript_875/g.1630  ORF Transcript_875/g.1630 Transcript_875/m.1630 type:complete len:314 (-) Transcript_875:1366-2307(-)
MKVGFVSSPWGLQGGTCEVASSICVCKIEIENGGGVSNEVEYEKKRRRRKKSARIPQEKKSVGSERRKEFEFEESVEWSAEKLGFVEIGVVLGAHGVRGELKVKASGDFANDRLGEKNAIRFLQMPGRLHPRPVTIVHGRSAAQAGVWIVRLDGQLAPKSREHANATMRGARLFVRATDRPQSLKPDEFLARELEGMAVKLSGDTLEVDPVGVIVEVVTAAEIAFGVSGKSGGTEAAAKFGNDLLVVKLNSDQSSVWVPFVREIVPFIDVLTRTVTLNPPQGLFDAARVSETPDKKAPRGLLPSAIEPHPQIK